MLKQLIYFIIYSCIIILTGCKKAFLDVSDKQNIERQDYVVDLNTTKEFLNGVYVLFSQDFYQGHNQIYPEIVADNVKPITTYFNVLTSHYNWSMTTPANDNMNRLWLSGYLIARSCSFVLEKAEEYKNQSPQLASDLKGQAHALRALVHFIMINTFAQSYNFKPEASHPGIPYAKSHDWTQKLPRLTVAEGYNEILFDLTKALELLPATPLNVSSDKIKFVMNADAAKGLLSRVYLFKEDYARSKDLSVAICKKIPLLNESDYPSKLFTTEETEAILQLVPAYPDGVNGSYFTNYQGSFFYDGMFSQFLATADIKELLTKDPNDRRKSWISSGGVGEDTIVKYPRGLIPGFYPAAGAYYQTILRSSEMCLTAAECFAHLNVDDSARYYLDAIRLRANPTASPTTTSGATLLEAIQLERRKELAFEGFRIFDLLRWKKGVNRADAVSGAPKTLSYPNNFAIAPLPDIDVKVAGMPQNPGY